METIRFEPAIGPDLQIDRRRRNADHPPTQDMFADVLSDQLKRRADPEPHELGPKRPERPADRRQAPDPLSGRPARIVLAHAPTLRGEAKQISEPADLRLSDPSRRPLDDGCERTAGDEAVCEEAVTGEEAIADQPAEAADDKEQTSDPLVTVAIVVQPADGNAATRAESSEVVAVDLAAPVPDETQDALPVPERSDDETNGEEDGADPATADAEPEQPVVEATLDAGLSAVVATLDAGGTTATAGTGAPGAPQQSLPLAGAALPEQQPVTDLPVTEATIAELTPPPAPPQPERPAAELKPRAGPAARPNAAEVTASPNPTNGPQTPIHPPLASSVPAGAQANLDGSGEPADASPSGDSSGPGWALHLAQGAAGKRADFVAQLKQHLQNLPAHEQVAVHIQRAVRDGTGKFSIQLSPAELGRIQVKLEIDEDKRVTAAVSVERPSTLELLQRDVKGLERALHDAGLTMDGGDLSFSLSRRSDQEWVQDQAQFGTAGPGGDRAGMLADGDQPEAGSGDVLDTAAGVVNLQI